MRAVKTGQKSILVEARSTRVEAGTELANQRARIEHLEKKVAGR